jgi:flagellar FliL protein
MTMAEEDDLELGDDDPGASKKKLIIIGGGILLLLIGIGVAAWLFLAGDEEDAADAEGGGAAQEEQAPVEKGPVTYHDMGPALVANLQGKPAMLQIGLQVRVYYPELAEFLKHNDPALRHSILGLLGSQDGKALQTREGKEALRSAIKDKINDLIKKYQGTGEVDEVLFSSFVMQ